MRPLLRFIIRWIPVWCVLCGTSLSLTELADRATLAAERNERAPRGQNVDWRTSWQLEWSAPNSVSRTFEILPRHGLRVTRCSAVRQTPHTPTELQQELTPRPDGSHVIPFESPAQSGTVMIDCEGAPEGRCQIVIRSSDKTLLEVAVNPRELTHQPREVPIPDSEERLLLRRVDADPLVITSSRPHAIYNPAEFLAARMDVHFPEAIDRKKSPSLHWEIRPARSNSVMQQGQLAIQIPRRVFSAWMTMDFQVPVPDKEGVYDYRFRVDMRDGRQVGPTSLQVVVLSSELAQERKPARTSPYLGMVLHSAAPTSALWGKQLDDPERHQRSIDWVNISQLARNLSDALQQQQARSLILGGNGEFPTLQGSGPIRFRSIRWNHGTETSGRPDSIVEDPLELVFQEFDRRGLTLVPELELDLADEVLEHQCLQDPSVAKELLLRNETGRTWRELHPDQSRGAHYDPLHPAVQRRIRSIVRDIVDRYRHHASFGGVAISIHGNSWSALPGPTWGRGAREFSAAQKQIGERPSDKAKSSAQTDALSTAITVVADRSRELAEFYSALGDEIAATGAQRRLVLTTDRLLDTRETRDVALQLIHSGQTLDQLFSLCGIEPRILARSPHLKLMRPFLSTPPQERFSGQSLLTSTLNASTAINQAFTPSVASIINLNPATSDAYSEIWSRSFSQGGVPEQYLVWNDRTEVRSAQFAIPREIFRQFPNGQLESIANVPQPLQVRTLSTRTETWILAINEAPFPVTWEFSLERSRAGDVPAITGATIEQSSTTDGPAVYRCDLIPFEIRTCRVATPNQKLLISKAVVPRQELDRIKARIEKVEQAFVTARSKAGDRPSTPLSPNDERHLVRSLSAIRLAWQEARYADCVRLLDGFWPKYVLEEQHSATPRETRLPQLGIRYRDLIVR